MHFFFLARIVFPWDKMQETLTFTAAGDGNDQNNDYNPSCYYANDERIHAFTVGQIMNNMKQQALTTR